MAYTTNQRMGEDRIRILVGLSGEVWREGVEGRGGGEEDGEEDGGGEDEGEEDDDGDDEQVGMLESEVGWAQGQSA